MSTRSPTSTESIAGKRSRTKRPRPSRKVLVRIKAAAAIRATGESLAQTAEQLGLARRTLYSYHERYPELCQRLYEAAKAGFNTKVAKTIGEPDAWTVKLHELRQQHAELNGRAQAEPQASQADLSPEMTLVEFFSAHAWPLCLQPKGDCERTRLDYLASLRLWCRLVGNPPISKIDKKTLSTFIAMLRDLPGVRRGDKLSAMTLFKHAVNILRLLQWTGPASRQNPNGTGLLQEPPWIVLPRREIPVPGPGFRLDELARWLRALPQVARPMPKMNGWSPAVWWRGVILLAYNTGMRPGTLFRLRWEMIDGHVVRAPASVVKGRHGRLLWLNEAALDAIEPLRQPSGLVFGWDNWPQAESTLKKHRIHQEQQAAIRTLPFYGFRRAFSTQCAKLNPIAAQLMLGHEGLGTAMMIHHYIDAEEILADTLAKLPQPENVVTTG